VSPYSHVLAKANKCSYIQWVAHCPAQNSPVKAEARVFNPLFKSANPSAHPSGDFLNDVNPDNEQIFPNAMVEVGFHEIRRRAPWPADGGERNPDDEKAETSVPLGPESVRFQAMRIAYFAVDSDTTDDKLVLNRIIGLKEGA
jgi:glutaminyl-tRNA synthetase